MMRPFDTDRYLLCASHLRVAALRGRHDRKTNRLPAAVFAMSFLAAWPSSSLLHSEVACKLPENATSISQLGSSQTAAEVHMDQSVLHPEQVHGAIHLDLRNDGPASLSELCASAHLADTDGNLRGATLILSPPGTKEKFLNSNDGTSCFTLSPAWEGYTNKSFDLHLWTDPNSIPSSGSVMIDSTRYAQEIPSKTENPTEVSRKKRRAGGASQPAIAVDCVSHVKPLARAVNLLPSKYPCERYLPLFGSSLVGMAYLGWSFRSLRGKLQKTMGGPQWSFGTSFATNFTVGTALLSLVLGGSIITETLHYMTKTHYIVLSLLFAAILLIAPALFSFFSTQERFPSSSGPAVMAPAGTVRLFILTSSLMVAAVVGQLCTVGLAMNEVRYRGYLGPITFFCFDIMLLTAGIGAFWSATRVAPSYLKLVEDPRNQKLVGQLKAIKARMSSLQSHVAGFAPTEAALADQDQIVLDHLIAREEAPPKWTMF